MKYSVGIDLGTTNTELSYCLLDQPSGSRMNPDMMKIPQFVEPSIIESRDCLPSCVYVGSEEERQMANWTLPWDDLAVLFAQESLSNVNESKPAKEGKASFFKKFFGLSSRSKGQISEPRPHGLSLVGEIAYRRLKSHPERTIASSKSWFTCSKVDRHEPILPWNLSSSGEKISPVDAARLILTHLVSAWNHQFPEDPLYDQKVVLTVPASFDASARELTCEAATLAGINLETLSFLEEPQAALYSWLAHCGDDWRNELKLGDVVLVCDVGGGTTDLSLLNVEEENGQLVLNRLAVGKRLLLGGDNMDLALSYRAASLFAEQGINLNPWQSSVLRTQCRFAKEVLLDDSNDQDSCRIAIAGESPHMLRDARSILFSKQEARNLIVEGFFPFCSANELPVKQRRFGIRESGLDYETDVAITRHIAEFLRSNGAFEEGKRPTKFLLNGGVFRSTLLQERLLEQFKQWFPDAPPTNLCLATDLSNSVARGASYYGCVKSGKGIPIRGSLPRSYYVGIECSGLAIPGYSRPLKALCVAPMGMEEGTECLVSSTPFELLIGETTSFRFFSSNNRRDDKPGDTINCVSTSVDESDAFSFSGLEETDPLELCLASDRNFNDPTVNEDHYVVVTFQTHLTAIGTLEIWCLEVNGEGRWKLEFDVRGK